MGILKGKINSILFKIDCGDKFKDLNEKKLYICGKLLNDRFKKDNIPIVSQVFGWTEFDNDDENNFKTDDVVCGSYVKFRLKNLERKISKKAVKILADEEIKKYKNDGIKITKEMIAEIKDKISFLLMTKTVPIPNYIEVVWNLDDDVLMFCNTSDKIIELFIRNFELSFGLKLLNIDSDGYLNYCSSKLVNTGLASTMMEKGLYGEDFLLYMWKNTKEGNYEYSLGNDNFKCSINDYIFMQNDKNKMIVMGEDDNASINAALDSGKVFKNAKLEFDNGDIIYKMTLKAENWAFKGIEIPKAEIDKSDSQENYAVFMERMYHIERLKFYLSVCILSFLK